MGELRTCLDQDQLDAAWQTRLVGPGDGELGRFQPGAGMAMGFDDLKVVEARRLAESISTGVQQGAGIDDAVAAARLVDAIVRSAEERRWVSP
jgi:predicted dehydrogenase